MGAQLQVDGRTSASSMVDARGNDRRRRERDLPKDAASLHWYDAEGTSYHSAESQARKSSRAPRNTDASSDTSVSAPVLCVQLASKGGVAHVIAREY
jgi:hypothetical protein